MIVRFAQLVVVLVTLPGASAYAQWLNHPSPGIPRTADGKPALSAPTPRSADGAIDLSGIWIRVASTRPELGVPGVSDYARYLIEGSPIDMLPAAAETYRKIVAVDGLGHPSETCLPKTFPNQILLPVPIQIVQSRGITFILFEEFNHFRQILTDGRNHPADMNPSWFGYSVGRWDGNTFVVETRGFRDDCGLMEAVTRRPINSARSNGGSGAMSGTCVYN